MATFRSVLFGQRLEQLVLVDEALGHGRLPGRHAGVLGLVEDVPELVVVDETEVDEHLAEFALAAARRAVAPLLLGDGLLGGGAAGRRLGLRRRRRLAPLVGLAGAAPGRTLVGLAAGFAPGCGAGGLAGGVGPAAGFAPGAAGLGAGALAGGTEGVGFFTGPESFGVAMTCTRFVVVRSYLGERPA